MPSSKYKYPEYNKAYRERNRDAIRAGQTAWRNANREHVRDVWRRWRKQDKEKNPEKYREIARNNAPALERWRKRKRAADPNYRIRTSLRWRLGDALRGRSKAGSAVSDLGCSIPEFRAYIERKFQPGMTWENWGRSTWHLDHIVPLAAFDLTNRHQLLSACHYTNLQPLWASENMAKKDRIIH